jgi:hypothetical protein
MTRNGYRCKTVNGEVRYEHVAIVEAALGKRLPVGAVVHHVDGNKFNNANANLVACDSQAYHMLLHARTRVIKVGGDPDIQAVCSKCYELKRLDDFHRNAHKDMGRHDACKKCRRRPRVSHLETGKRDS